MKSPLPSQRYPRCRQQTQKDPIKLAARLIWLSLESISGAFGPGHFIRSCFVLIIIYSKELLPHRAQKPACNLMTGLQRASFFHFAKSRARPEKFSGSSKKLDKSRGGRQSSSDDKLPALD
jgi:hypothetical protein